MNILITSAGRRTYMIEYFKKALGGSGLVHASNSIYTHTLSVADRWVLTPGIYDARYIDFLLRYCVENDITAVISLFDIDLPVLAKNKECFESRGIRVIVSDPGTIETCNDKWLTYQFLRRHDIATPGTYLQTGELLSALRNGTISFPVIMKPRWGMGSLGIYKVDNPDELAILHSKLKRSIFDTYLRFESASDRENCVIFQEMIEGPEYGLDILNDLQGNYVTTVAKHKIAMRAGETDIARILPADRFEGVARQLSEGLRHIANLDVDCLSDDSGTLFVVDLNCRFGGQYPFSHLAGADFPKQIMEWCMGKGTDPGNLTVRHIAAGKELSPVVID